MATAPLLRQPILPLAGLTAALALYPKTSVHAEEPPSDPIKIARSRKPIYDPPSSTLPPSTREIASTTPPPASGLTTTPQPQSPTSPTPTDRLAKQIKRTRLYLHTHALRLETTLNTTQDGLMSAEHSLTSTIAALAPPKESNEKLLPGGIYVLVAAMAGSILSRNRNVFLRFATPVVMGVATAQFVVPRTARNVGDLVWRYEERVPLVRDNHLRVSEGVRHLIETGKAHSQMGVAMAEERVQGVRESVEAWVKKGR